MESNKKPITGIDQPKMLDTTMAADKNITTGTKASLTNTKHHAANMVKTANKSSTQDTGIDSSKSESEPGYLMLKSRTEGKLMNNYITPLKEGDTYDDSRLFAKVEQLLQESKILLEFHNNRNQNFATSGAGGQTGSKGTESYMQQGQKPTTTNYNNQVRAKIDDDRERRNSSIRNASKVEPQMTAQEQTLGIKAPIADRNSQARLQGAQNHEASLAAKQQEQEGHQNG